MQRFHVIDEGAVVVRVKGGLYRQCKVYRRGRDVFAGVGGGYIRLLARAGTTNPNVTWLELEADGVTLTGSGQPLFQDGEPAANAA